MRPIIFIIIFLCTINAIHAQDDRANLPFVLKNSYFGLNAGFINYPFSQESLEPGYTLESTKVPHPALRFILYGHNFNKYLSAQITYMRPVSWVELTYRKDDKWVRKSTFAEQPDTIEIRDTQQVWMNVASITVLGRLPVYKKLWLYGEVGLTIITRNGFANDLTKDVVVKDANYASILLGGGLTYSINRRWGVTMGVTYSPPNKANKQPYTIFYSAGFTYSMFQPSEKNIEKGRQKGYIHPKQWISIGLTGNAFGYNVNEFLSSTVTVFWGGDIRVRGGLSLSYQRNIFHTPKVFAFDWGVNLSWWTSNIDGTHFWTLSIFPVLRFNFLRTKPADLYFFYSVAGPTFISRLYIDYNETGGHFTFQDTMGIGAFLGAKKNINAEVRIGHYSNGNLFPQNPGVMIPLTLSLGHAL